jgi:hypothetical protein
MSVEQYKRIHCQHCGLIMRYVFPSPQKNSLTEQYVSRFQFCKECGESLDVRTGDYYLFTMRDNALYVNGVNVGSIDLFVSLMHFLEVTANGKRS